MAGETSVPDVPVHIGRETGYGVNHRQATSNADSEREPEQGVGLRTAPSDHLDDGVKIGRESSGIEN